MIQSLQHKAKSLLQIHVLFALLAVIFGTYFLFTIPLLWGYDETQHFSRAYQISMGHVLPEQLPDSQYGGSLPKSLINFTYKTQLDLQNNKGGPFYARRDIDRAQLYTNESQIGLSGKAGIAIFNGSAIYSPVAYAPAIVGIKVTSLFHASIRTTILSARMAMLISYIVLVTGALYIFRNNKARYIVFVVGLLPMALAQAAVVSADTLANALGLLLAAIFILAATNKFRVSRKVYAILLAALVSLPLVKFNYIFMGLPFLLIKPPFAAPRINVQRWYARISIFLLAVLPSLVWLTLTKDVASNIASAIPYLKDTVDPTRQFGYVINHPIMFIAAFATSFARYGDEYVYGLTSSVGWNYVGLPLLGIVIVSALLMVATIQTASLYRLKGGGFDLVLLAAGILAIASIFASFYLTFTPVGKHVIQGVQSRYFIPAMPFILYGVGRFVPFHIRELSATKSALFYSLGMGFVLLLGSVWYFLSTY